MTIAPSVEIHSTNQARSQLGGGSLESKLLGASFLILLFLFMGFTLVKCLFGAQVLSVEENRALTKFERPRFHSLKQLSKFPGSFEAFWADRLAFRLPLLSNLAFARFTLFGSGNKSVLVGKNGWLFYIQDGAEAFVRNYPPLPDSSLDRWGKFYERRKAFCDTRGIKFLLYVPPLASTIYPEMIPDGFKYQSQTSRLDQLFAHLREKTSVEFVDLRPKLLAAKDSKIYLKTDTHWNSLGAFIATGDVLRKLKTWFPKITLLDKQELLLEPQNYNGDLLAMLGINQHTSEPTLRAPADAPRLWRSIGPCYDEVPITRPKSFATVVDNPSLPSAVCIRDSFTISQKLYLSNHFRRIVYCWEGLYPEDVIEREKPDVVLQANCERNFSP